MQLLPQNWGFLDREHVGCTTTQPLSNNTQTYAQGYCVFLKSGDTTVQMRAPNETKSELLSFTELQAEIPLLTKRMQQV